MKILATKHNSPFEGCFWRWEHIGFKLSRNGVRWVDPIVFTPWGMGLGYEIMPGVKVAPGVTIAPVQSPDEQVKNLDEFKVWQQVLSVVYHGLAELGDSHGRLANANSYTRWQFDEFFVYDFKDVQKNIPDSYYPQVLAFAKRNAIALKWPCFNCGRNVELVAPSSTRGDGGVGLIEDDWMCADCYSETAYE